MSVSIHARKSEAGLTGGKSIRSKSVLIKRRKGEEGGSVEGAQANPSILYGGYIILLQTKTNPASQCLPSLLSSLFHRPPLTKISFD